MASKPALNPHYFQVKAEGDYWISKALKMDKKMTQKTVDADFCYLASAWAPDADPQRLRMMLDWNHWVFPFDDLFDEGCLRDDPVAAREEIKHYEAIMDGTATTYSLDDHPLRHIFQTCCFQVKEAASGELYEVWKRMHQGFFDSFVAQVDVQASGRSFTRDVEEYRAVRRATVGVYPTVALIMFAQGIDIPINIFEHPSLQECMDVAADLTALGNDVLSYPKDLRLGVDHNLVSLLSEQGLSIQEAFNEIGNMLDACHKRWYLALADLPLCGELMDRRILEFVEACKRVALGTNYWSFKTGRYNGINGQEIRETLLMRLPPV